MAYIVNKQIDNYISSLRETRNRLASRMDSWNTRHLCSPEQIATANSATLAIDEAVAKLEILKEKMQ
jgi:hypothetical protein